jgi:ornithine decarboxylase
MISPASSGKFGAAPDQAIALLRMARRLGRRLGVCFHVGSQCLDPAAYERALGLAGAIVRAAGVRLDVLDVGGGFPVSYPDVTPPPLQAFIAAIRRGCARIDRPADSVLWCEPGRALVAPAASLVVRVQLRRGHELFLNDGVYGTLSDAGAPGFRFPVRRLRPAAEALHGSGSPLQPFTFFGPTCDSADRMAGPFLLPGDICEGDWIEIGQLGAYGTCLRTQFNGFAGLHRAFVADPPLLATPGYEIPEPAVEVAAGEWLPEDATLFSAA